MLTANPYVFMDLVTIMVKRFILNRTENVLAIYQDMTFKIIYDISFCILIKRKFLFHLAQMTHLRLIKDLPNPFAE